jgi:hypothetical protein
MMSTLGFELRNMHPFTLLSYYLRLSLDQAQYHYKKTEFILFSYLFIYRKYWRTHIYSVLLPVYHICLFFCGA